MKTFVTALLVTATCAVNVMKARHNPAYDSKPATSYEEPEEETTQRYKPAPRYAQDEHYHHEEPAKVWFREPHGPNNFYAPEVEYETNWYAPYVPKYKVNHVDVEHKEADLTNDYPTFDKYEFLSTEEEKYGDPIYNPATDRVHKAVLHCSDTEGESVTCSSSSTSTEEEAHGHREEESSSHASDVGGGHVEQVYEEEFTYGGAAYCECADVAAERDQLQIQNDDLTSKLALYRLKFGEILAEPTAYYGVETEYYSEPADEVPEFEVYHESEESDYDEPTYEEPEETQDYFNTDDLHIDNYKSYDYGGTGFFDYVLSQGYDGNFSNYNGGSHGHDH